MSYRYKMAEAVRIGDLLYTEVEKPVVDPRFPDMQPKLVKTPLVLKVTSIERDYDDMPDGRIFIDGEIDLTFKAKLGDRLRLVVTKEEA